MKTTLLLIALLSASFGFSQTYTKVYIDQKDQFDLVGQVICHEDKHGIVIAGIDGNDAVVYRIDSTGNVLWQKRWENNANSFPKFKFFEVLSTSDSAFLVIGSIQNTATSTMSAYAMKLDVDGNLLWQRAYDNGLNENCSHSAAVETTEGDYLISWGFSFNGNSFSIVKIDPNGTTQWTKSFTEADPIVITDMEVLNDSTYIVAGSMNETGNPNYIALLAAFDAAGNLLWTTAYNNLYIDDILVQNDEIYISGKQFATSGDYVWFIADNSGTITGGFTPNSSVGSNGLDVFSQMISLSDSTVFLLCPDDIYSITGFKIHSGGTISTSTEVYMRGGDVMLNKDKGVTILGDGPTYGLKTIWQNHVGIVQTDSTLNIPDCGYTGTATSSQIPLLSSVGLNFTPGSTPVAFTPTINAVTVMIMDTLLCPEQLGGLNELQAGLEVKVYPNASNGVFNFEWNSDASAMLRIVSVLGNEVMLVKDVYQSTRIDLGNEPNGMYYYQLIDADGIGGSGTIVLQD